MIIKLNHALNRFLKTELVLSVLFIFLSIFTVDNGVSGIFFGLFAVFSFFALWFSLCHLIPIVFLKALARMVLFIVTIIGVLMFADLTTIIIMFKYGYIDGFFVMYMFIAIIFFFPAMKNANDEIKDPLYTYRKNLSFFKKFLIFLLVIMGIGGLIVGAICIFAEDGGEYLLNDSTFQRFIINFMLYVALYFVIELILVRTSRNMIYAGIKPLSRQKLLTRYLCYGIGTGGIAALFLIFKDELDTQFDILIERFKDLFAKIKVLWEKLTKHIERLIAGDIKEIEYKPDADLSGLMDKFNIKDFGGNFGGFGENGNFGASGMIPGGIGSIGGIGNLDGMGGMGGMGGIGNIGGMGGSYGGFGSAGMIGLPVSESGTINGGSYGLLGEGGNNSALAFIKTENSTTVYLRLKSFGSYNGQGWDEAVEYEGLLDETYGMNYLTGSAIGLFSEAKTIEIQSLTGQYFLPDYLATGKYYYDFQLNDVISRGKTEEPYSLKYYDYHGTYVDYILPESFREEELLYREFVYENYLELPENTRIEVLDFMAGKSIYPHSSQRMQKVFDLLSNYTYNLEYDRKLDSEDDVVMSFLTEYQEGICQHFASSGVVMFRALGIPARYVGGLAVDNTVSGDWTVVTANAAHAWVEIYQDGIGWVRIDPTSYATLVGEKYEESFGVDEYLNMVNGNSPSSIGGLIGGMPGGDGENPGGDQGGDDDQEGGDNIGGSGTGEDNTGGNGTGGGGTGGNGTGGAGTGGNGGNNTGGGNTGEGTGGNTGGGTNEGGGNNNTNNDNENNSSSDEKLETIIGESCDNVEIPWGTIGIVSGVLVVGVVAFIVIKQLRKKKFTFKSKKLFAKDTENMTEDQKMMLAKEEDKVASQIVRESYKSFIKLARKHGIRRYPIDTTQSLREKYNQEIGPNDAMEILTGLYRTARYNKYGLLTMEDASQSQRCLKVIKDEFSNMDNKK